MCTRSTDLPGSLAALFALHADVCTPLPLAPAPPPCRLAAFEVEPATYAMAIRTFKEETTLTPAAAFLKLRSAITDGLAVRQAGASGGG